MRHFWLKTGFLSQNTPFFMKIPHMDSGLHMDDPNLHYGYLLEPGDPGYIPPISPINEPKTKRKKMKHNNYYPLTQSLQLIWLANFSGKLPALATVLGLTTTQVTAAVADCKWLIYILELWLPAVRKWAPSCTDASFEAQFGTGSAVQLLPVFVAPPLPEGVVAVNPGALLRIFALVQDIKNSGKCSDANATNLGIVGSEQAGPDMTSIHPEIAASILGNHVFIKWGWGGYTDWLDSCEIQVDRADGKGFVMLVMDTTPGYTDTMPFPAVHTVWTYRAIYRVGENQVGVWSQTVSVAVPT
jgi:hypothetical protein